MAKNRDQIKHSAISRLKKASSKNLRDKGWNSILNSINKSISSGLSADFSFIYWQNPISSKFDVLSVIGDSKGVIDVALDKKLIPAKWTKKNDFKTLFSSSGRASSAEPNLIKELRKNESDAMLVPISSDKKLKGFIFSQNLGNCHILLIV